MTNHHRNNTGKILSAAAVRLLAAVTSGILLLALVYCIPVSRISEHVRKSAVDTIQHEGLYPEITHFATSYLDNWTDSIMLAEAAYPIGDTSPLQAAMQVPRSVADEFPDQSLVKWALTGETVYDTVYPQYWHGYLVWLKPLLLLTDLHGIRILNAILQTGLLAAVAVLLYRRNRRAYILPFFISVAMLMPVAMAKSMQFSSCYLIFLIASVAVLLNHDEGQTWKIFLYAGIATAYFDFLTYPISTFGIPAVMELLLRERANWKENLKRLGGFFLVWAAAYGLMWGAKIVAGGLITGADFFAEAGDHMFHWFDGERWFSTGYVFYFNVRDFIYTPVSFLAIILVLVLAVRMIREKTLPVIGRSFRSWLPYLVLMLLPFAWYLFLFNPSGIHHFFTNKACVVTAFSGLSMLTAMANAGRGGEA